MPMKLAGIHHVTAIASDPAANAAFYTEVLGLRLVKKTVNFDDPSTYHLYYGDDIGTPGTILTFFPWPNARQGTPGVGQVTGFAFQAPLGSLSFWRKHLESAGLAIADEGRRFGEEFIAIQDPDEFVVEFIETAEAASTPPARGTTIPPEYALRGFHGSTLSLEAQEKTGAILTQLMGAVLETSEGNRFRYTLGEGPARARVDLLCLPAGRWGTGGTGIVHHIAWRTPDDASQLTARNELVSAGLNVSPVIDRNYFHSIYYREPGGVLFEIATDPPGFAVDEPLDALGSKLMLPEWLETHRAVLEATLPPLK
ncbi:MAG: ring-cleaving dioxygenase [Verrucomicrobia bacterium]|nr:ring-cleaving dioxygenase [Verrucomicrobiota bacterium]MBV8274472.1 ring-cleaving dioxygenase [Verrucomicrobiota bacterium]